MALRRRSNSTASTARTNVSSICDSSAAWPVVIRPRDRALAARRDRAGEAELERRRVAGKGLLDREPSEGLGLAVEIHLGRARRPIAAPRPPPGRVAGLAFAPRPPTRTSLRIFRLRIGHVWLQAAETSRI